MEKLTKNIHNHTFTDLIKVCIFALILLLPGIIFLPSALYYGFNEHATNTETTTINYKYESNEVNTRDDLVEGNIYEINATNYYIEDIVNTNGEIGGYLLNSLVFNDYIRVNDYTHQNSIEPNVYVSIRNDGDASYIDLYTSYEQWEQEDYSIEYIVNTSFNDNFIIQLFNYSSNASVYAYAQYTDYNVIESVSVNTDDTISTKLYRSWETMWQTPLFQWTNNTPLNTGINGFIGVFGINSQSYIGNLLIWLLSITAIYVVVDIVIGVFKWLTHLIGNH